MMRTAFYILLALIWWYIATIYYEFPFWKRVYSYDEDLDSLVEHKYGMFAFGCEYYTVPNDTTSTDLYYSDGLQSLTLTVSILVDENFLLDPINRWEVRRKVCINRLFLPLSRKTETEIVVANAMRTRFRDFMFLYLQKHPLVPLWERNILPAYVYHLKCEDQRYSPADDRVLLGKVINSTLFKKAVVE